MNIQQAKDEFDRQYRAIISLPEKAFFVGIANYVKSVLGNADLTSIESTLLQKAHKDYDDTIAELSKDPSISVGKDWEFADFVAAGKRLAEKQAKTKNVSIKEQFDVSHAWMKLRNLEMFIHDRDRAKSIYSKTERGKFQYELSVTELDLIFDTRANERNNDEYDDWVRSGLKNSLEEVRRTIFVQDEYLNYLTQVHNYFMEQLSKHNVFHSIVFPEGQAVLYRNGILSFNLGDGTHDSIDFSTAPELKKVFDVFWENKVRNLESRISSIKALELYRSINNEEIDKRQFGYLVSHIRGSKINKKPRLKDRIKISFDRKTESWVYEWR